MEKIKFIKLQSKKEAKMQDGKPLSIYTFMAEWKEIPELFKTFSKRVEDYKNGDDLEGEIIEREYQGNRELVFKFPPSALPFKRNYAPRSEEERWEIIRQNALGHALKFFELNQKEVEMKDILVVAETFAWFSKNKLRVDLDKEYKKLEKEEPEEAPKEPEEEQEDEVDLDKVPF